MGYLSHLTKFQAWLLGLALVGLAIAQINQPFPQVAPLHHVPTLLVILSAPAALRKWPISNGALACLLGFLALHTLGGRYTYTNTPYDAWFAWLFGSDLSSLLGWERNHYDRLVHFSFGLLMVLPIAELLRRYVGVTKTLALYVGVEFVMGISAIYEIFEWLLSILLAPDNVEAYNGQQGDIWDAQKDMALAFAGALVAACTIWIRGRTHKE